MQIGGFLKIQWTDLYKRRRAAKPSNQLDNVDALTLERIRARRGADSPTVLTS